MIADKEFLVLEDKQSQQTLKIHNFVIEFQHYNCNNDQYCIKSYPPTPQHIQPVQGKVEIISFLLIHILRKLFAFF